MLLLTYFRIVDMVQQLLKGQEQVDHEIKMLTGSCAKVDKKKSTTNQILC